MFWIDKISEEIIKSGNYKPYWVDDMKTPSGFAHVGSLMGPVIHSMVYKSLKDKGQEAKFTFIINDFDPADDLLPEIRGTHEAELGKPLKLAKSPDPKFESFADLFGNDFITAIKNLGVDAQILSSWEMYHEGKFDDVIRLALDNAEKIQDIYQRVSGSQKKQSGWLPFQVICENCGKLGTTKVYAWDGDRVSYKCEPDLVVWAKGCGHEGKISPFGGTGKLPWKVDWPAHWKVIGVTIEGAGKDHASKGGSYDIAMTICREVFDFDPPFKMPYEFILIGGRKMSSSKGLGLKAHDLVDILPPEVARFLYARNGIKSQTNFDPDDKNAIPVLFDDYQKAAEAYFSKTDEDLGRAFEISQVDEIKRPPSVRFSVLAQWVQMPNMEQKIKEEDLEQWAKYAKVWVERFAPEDMKFEVKKELPENLNLNEKQKEFLIKLNEKIGSYKSGEDFQIEIYELGKELKLDGKEAFQAIYLSLLGKDHGPKAGWLILSLDPGFVKNRFEEASKESINSNNKSTIIKLNKPEIFSIDANLAEKFPSLSVGIAIIKGVSIKEKDEELEKEKEELLKSFENLTTEGLGAFPETMSYRRLYKEMGVDWHSRRPSPEALLRRVALKKGLYSINTAVDAYNLVVMKNRVSVGAFDLDKIEFPTLLRLAKNDEEIHLLGDDDSTRYTEKEIAYFDKNGGYNMDFNFRDAKRTAVGMETKNIYLNVDGIYDVTPEKVLEVLEEAVEKILKYCGGEIVFLGVEKA